jgi:hypothetical protein
VVKRVINGVEEFAAIFPSLPAGTHKIFPGTDKSTDITIFAGQVGEVDLR